MGEEVEVILVEGCSGDTEGALCLEVEVADALSALESVGSNAGDASRDGANTGSAGGETSSASHRLHGVSC